MQSDNMMYYMYEGGVFLGDFWDIVILNKKFLSPQCKKQLVLVGEGDLLISLFCPYVYYIK